MQLNPTTKILKRRYVTVRGKTIKPLTDRQWFLNNLKALENPIIKGFKSKKWQKEEPQKKKKKPNAVERLIGKSFDNDEKKEQEIEEFKYLDEQLKRNDD